MRLLFVLLAIFLASPAHAQQGCPATAFACGGRDVTRSAADCTTQTGGITDELCIDDTSGAGTGLWFCPTGLCNDDNAWERVDSTTNTGDEVTVNSTTVDTTGNLLDGDVDFSLADGGAGGPDDITATVACTGCIDVTDMASNSVDSAEIVDGSVDLSHMSSSSVDSDNIVDATIAAADISDNVLNLFEQNDYSKTIGDNLVMEIGEGVLSADGISSVRAGGLIFEGATKNDFEHHFIFLGAADTIDDTYFVVSAQTAGTVDQVIRGSAFGLGVWGGLTSGMMANDIIDGDDIVSGYAGNGLQEKTAASPDNMHIPISTVALTGTGTTNAFTGLEITQDRLTIIQGCAEGNYLEWDNSAEKWQCKKHTIKVGHISFNWVGTITTSDEFTITLWPVAHTLARVACQAYEGTSFTIKVCKDEDRGDDVCGTYLLGDSSATLVCGTAEVGDAILNSTDMAANQKVTVVVTAVSGTVTDGEIYFEADVP